MYRGLRGILISNSELLLSHSDESVRYPLLRAVLGAFGEICKLVRKFVRLTVTAYLPILCPTWDSELNSSGNLRSISKRKADLAFPWPIGLLLQLYNGFVNRDFQYCCGIQMHVDFHRFTLFINFMTPQISTNVSKESGNIWRTAGTREPLGAFRKIRISRRELIDVCELFPVR
jgi:hypothetical protein